MDNLRGLTGLILRRQSVPENRRRVAVVQGICIARRNRGYRTSFTIRNHIGTAGGIERTFPLCVPRRCCSCADASLRRGQSRLRHVVKAVRCVSQVFAQHTGDRCAGLEEGPQGEAVLSSGEAAKRVQSLHQNLTTGSDPGKRWREYTRSCAKESYAKVVEVHPQMCKGVLREKALSQAAAGSSLIALCLCLRYRSA